MKLKRRRVVEVPPNIRTFIDGVIATPHENIEEPLKTFVWDFGKGDFHHWVDLFKYFDTLFDKYIKSRKDFSLEDDFLENDPPFPKEAVLQILRVVRTILDNCKNKYFFSSYENHLSSLLASTDVDVVEACLETLGEFLKKSFGKQSKHVLRNSLLSSKLFAFAQGWGGKEEGLGLVACALENISDPVAHELGSTLHFEFYVDENESFKGLQTIHLPKVNTYLISDRELMQQLVKDYKVPTSFRFSLLTRLRFARAFDSNVARLQYTCIRLRAFIVFVQACGDTDDIVSFFRTQTEFINELVTLLSYEDTIPREVRILCMDSLAALCQDRVRQPTVLSTITSGAHHGILPSLTHKVLDAVAIEPSEWSVVYAEDIISLVMVLVSSSSGCSAMRESGFITTLLPLLKDTHPRHLNLVTTAVHVLEAFMDYSDSAAALFRDLGGLEDSISRLKVEVSHVENGTSLEMDCREPLYSNALVTRYRRSLMKALLRAISLGTYAPSTASRVYGTEGSPLPYCLCVIIKKSKDFGGGVFSLAATVMSDLIQKDPTCFSILEAAGLPSAFLRTIMDGVLFSSEAIICIPQCLDSLCLNNSGLQAVKDHNSLRCFVKMFTARSYLRALTGDTISSLSSGLDELMRHASSLRGQGVDVLIEILKTIEKLGFGHEIASVPMETDEKSDKLSESSAELFLPDFVNNVARLLENILQNSDTCSVFIEKKGVEAALQLFLLPLMPSSVSVGQSIAVAFKNFCPRYSGSLAQSICSFMREHLKIVNELLVSLGGMQLSQVDDDKRTEVLRFLSSFEGILCLLISLTKRSSNLLPDLGASYADMLRDLGATFREILWQQSLGCDSKIEKRSADMAAAGYGDVIADVTIPGVRYLNSSHPHLGLEREYHSIGGRSEGVSRRRSRNLLDRLRGGRAGRHHEALEIDFDSLINNTDATSLQNLKTKSPEALVMENLDKLASTMRSFFLSLVEGFNSPNRRRAESESLSPASMSIGTALAKNFLEALTFSGYTAYSGLDTSLTLKCRFLGKVVDHMAGLTFDRRQGTCYTVMINNFYVHGTFKQLLNTFEATSQLLWTLPYSISTSGVDLWLLNTLMSYCHLLEFFLNSSFLLPPAFTSHARLVIQPDTTGLSLRLFPVLKDPKVFVRMLQSQVLDVILPVWNHPMFPSCNSGFVTRIVTLLNHVYCGVSDRKLSHGSAANKRFNTPALDEATIATIMEMGFTRGRAEEALRHVERNSVEMAMEWLFSHPEDPEQEDDEMTEALALSLGSSSETPKSDNTEKLSDDEKGIMETKTPPIDDILDVMLKLVQGSDSIAFPLTDLLTTLCIRDKGEDRKKVISFLIQQMKLSPLEIPKYTSPLCTISHTLALLLTEDLSAREIAAENGIASVSLDILVDFNARTKSRNELPVPKCISALLLILHSLLQFSPKIISDSIEGTKMGSPQEDAKIFEKSTGYLTMEEGERAITVVCDMVKQNVPGMVMQAALLLCGRLTKTHTLSLNFLENGGVDALFSIPRTSFFLIYDSVISAIVRHLIEDPQALQTAMELEIKQILSASRYAGRILPRVFLTSMAPLISRDPEIFMKAAATLCQVETLGGRTSIVLFKDQDKSKVPGVEIGVSTGQKKIPANLTQVIHHMVEIVMNNTLSNSEDECNRPGNSMEFDEPAISKGKFKVDETRKDSESLQERSTGTAKLSFILKLLSDILLMHVHAVGIVLKRDLEICQLRGSNGIVHHILHHFLLVKKSGSDESRAKLCENASRFLVVLCGRSSEGRRRVINELVKLFISSSYSARNSSKGRLLPTDKKVVASVDLVYSILSKSSSSSNLIGSPDIAKGMIDGGMIPWLSSILQVLDLDHPDAPKVVNIILKVLEGLTRAANVSDRLSLSDSSNKKKNVTDNQTREPNQNSQHEVNGTEDEQQLPQQTSLDEGDNNNTSINQAAAQEMRIDVDGMDDSGLLQNTGDEDDDMVDNDDDHVDVDDDGDGDVEDEENAEDGPALMSLADTDVEDHDEYNDGMVDNEDDAYHENNMQVIGLPGADNGLIGMIGVPFEAVNDHNPFGVGRPLRQQNRTSQSGIQGNGLRHPLLSRPSQFGDSGSIRPSGGNFDVPTPLGDFSVGVGSMYASGRRGVGDSRWTDDGQPQDGSHAVTIVQAIEEQFMSRLHSYAERQSHNLASLVSQSDAPLPDENQLGDSDQNAMHIETNQVAEGDMTLQQVQMDVAVEQIGEDQQALHQDNMEIGGDESFNDQVVEHGRLPATDNETGSHQLATQDNNVPNSSDHHVQVGESVDVEMNIADLEANENRDPHNVAQDNSQTDEISATNEPPNENGIDPTFLEALPEDLRAEVLASQQAQSNPAPALSSDVADDIDPEFLAALPPDIQAEVIAQQRAQRIARQAEGQTVDMDNASIIATFPADLRNEVLLTSSESVISALPSPMLAEAQMLRDRAMSHYHARSSLGSNHGLNNRRNGLGLDRHTVTDRGIGITIGHKASSIIAESLKVKDVEGDPLLDTDALKSLIRLLRVAQPLAKGLLQRLLLNLCAHNCTREMLIYLVLDMIKPQTEGTVVGSTKINSQRLYGCQSNVVYSRSQLIDGLPPLVLKRILEILTYLATNHPSVADILCYFDSSRIMQSLNPRYYDKKNDKGKEKVVIGREMSNPFGLSMECDVPILMFTKLLNRSNIAHLEQFLGLVQVVVNTVALKLECLSHTVHAVTSSQCPPGIEATAHPQKDYSLAGAESGMGNTNLGDGLSTSDDQISVKVNNICTKLPQTDLHHLCSLLGHEGLSDKVYTVTGEILKKLALIAPLHRNFFIAELSDLAHSLSHSAMHELCTFRSTQILSLSTGSMSGASVLRILQILDSLTVLNSTDTKSVESDGDQVHAIIWKLNVSLEPLWQELSKCIGVIESQLGQGSSSSVTVNLNVDNPPLPPGTQRILPFIEAFLLLCDKLLANNSLLHHDNVLATASEVKQLPKTLSPSQTIDGTAIFTKFAEKHRRMLNAFIRQDPSLLEKSLSMLLKAPRFMDFDNKRAYFRSRIRQQHDQHLAGSLRISVRRAYVLEDSYHQLRMRPLLDMKGRLNVRFQGEEGIDAGGLTREWYQLLSRVIFDKGALLFTTGGNDATYQPNPNSVYQTEHISYFKFVGRVVAKALFDGQLLDVYFTRSFYKHILGVKVTYHDIEAVDPDYYKNLKWMLENDVSEIPDLTFSMDADEEKHILYEKTEVTDYELKPGGRNTRVTEETKHEYVDLVADHRLTNAIRPQINSFLEGFNELIPREMISIFNDKELELLISGLPEIDLNDLKANTEYTGYTATSIVIIWFWEVVEAFNKEDRARLLQFVTGTSKVPLEGFKALQGITGPQRFQIHKAYGAPERLPSAHTCFNQLDLPEYMSKEQLEERLLLAIHEASEGFGFA